MSPTRERDRIITQPVPPAEAERRLRPALDVLFSSDNPRPALKIATQAEAKRPGWPAARAVRALALRRLGRREEAQQLALAVLSDLETGAVPVDEDAAAKLHLFFRESPRQEYLSARAYDAVAKGSDWDAYLWETAFFWHLRARDFSAAQRVAATLQRNGGGRSKGEYAFWSTVSIWLGNRGPERNAKLGALAGAMLKKALSCFEVPSAEQVRFAVRLFCDAGKYNLATVVLEDENVVMDASEVAHLRADVAYKTKDKAAAIDLYRIMLADGDADDWGHWLRLIELTALDSEHAKSTEDLVRTLCERASEGSHASRGQFLADLELRRRKQDWMGLGSGVVSYFQRFGRKNVCAHDLRPYVIALVSREDCPEGYAASICSELTDHAVNGASSGAVDGLCRDEIERHLNASRLRLWLGCLEDTIPELLARYEVTLDSTIDATERQLGDDYVLLAAHQALPFANGKGRYSNLRNVFRAILLVEAGLARSPFNFHFKLLLVLLYNSVGCVQRSFDLWRSLDIKHVQVATLSHLVTRGLVYHGCREEFSYVEDKVEKLWQECEREIPESFARALGAGSLNAAVEFLEFQERLERSSSFAQFMICQALVHANSSAGDTLGVAKAWNTVGEEARVLPESLRRPAKLIMNDDLSCLEFWDPSTYQGYSCCTDHDSGEFDAGRALSNEEQTALLVELLVIRGVCRLAVPGELSAEELEALKQSAAEARSEESTGCPLPSRVHYLSEMFQTVVSLQSALQESTAAAPVEVTQSLRYIDATVENLVGEAIFVDGEAALSPLSFTAAGLLINESLLVSCVGLTSLSKAFLACKDKQIKGIAASVVNAYSQALNSACSKVEGLLRPILDNGEQWLRAWMQTKVGDAVEEESLLDAVPASVPVNENDSDAKNHLLELSQLEFCERIRRSTLEMQQASARNLLESMRPSLQKLRMLALA